MRANVGVNPSFLVDQHLIAEYVELMMLIGSLQYNNWSIKSEIPMNFTLGTGHMNFLKKRLKYIQKRHNEVKKEMIFRGFKCDLLTIDLNDIPKDFCLDWTPSLKDSMIIRDRLLWKLNPKRHLPSFWRYYRKKLTDVSLQELMFKIQFGKLYEV